jgi:hypothetical protein
MKHKAAQLSMPEKAALFCVLKSNVDPKGNAIMTTPMTDEQEEQAAQMVKTCPREYWIVEDLERKTVYYKNQKSPHNIIPTAYTTNHVLIAHRKFIHPYRDGLHIALDMQDEVNANPKLLHYCPAW